MKNSLQKARQKYDQKRITKSVSFNSETEQELLIFTENIDFSNWVKAKIKGDIESDKFRSMAKKNE